MKLLSKIFDTFVGIFNCIFLAVQTVFWCIPMYILYAFKILSSNPKWRRFINVPLIATANNWIRSNNLMMDMTMNIKWSLPDFSKLKLNDWYFIVCNHQSWVDILVLQRIFLKKVPFIRFFIKKELNWLPVLGLAWWAYDFPIMHRHTKAQIEKNPSLRLKDLQATQKACEKYQHMPVTILNFLEGTRFTPQKHDKQQSRFKHLLEPKSGGFAFAVSLMKQKITHVLDVTIHYPDGIPTFWDFLRGRVKAIQVDMTLREVPAELIHGNYNDDENFRKQFKGWIDEIWRAKDQLLDRL